MQTGTIDIGSNSFDIAGLGETETSILLTPTQLQLSYRDESGQLVRYTKSIPAYYYKKALAMDPRNVAIGTKLTATSDAHLMPGERGPTVGKSLVNLNWADTSAYETKTVNGRLCAKIPISI